MRRIFISFLVLAAFAAACGDDAEPVDIGSADPTTTTTAPPTSTLASAEPVASTADRSTPDPSADVAALAVGINDAGFVLMRTLPGDENGVLSPTSVGHALLMAQGAADDTTRASIDAAFGFGADAHEAWNAIDQAIGGAQSDRVIVEIADRIWPRIDVQPDPTWIDLLASRHGADVVPLDFAGDTDGTRDVINDWVAEQTQDRIEDLLPPGFIQANTTLVLTNTVFFDADWQQPFGKYGPLDGEFTLLDGTTVPVELMVELELGDRRGEGDGFVGAEIPYAGGDYSMLVLVPDEGTFDDFAARLDQSLLDEIDATFSTGPFELHLPKWETSTNVDLLEWLTNIGAAPGSYPGITPGTFLDAAVHAADIEVNELGTVAAAATALGFEDSGPPEPELTIAADQPFVYLIRHRASGLVLFAGQVVDPTA